jgi:hypothetical protein
MRIVGFVGTKGVGKDTAANVLVFRHGFVRRKFAQPIKEACGIIFQLPQDHFENDSHKERVNARHGISPRQMMQMLGTDMFRRMVDVDFWIHHFQDWCADQPDDTKVVVTDLRFQNEIDAVKRLGGLVVCIKRQGGEGRHRSIDNHITESGIEFLKGVDVYVENDGSVEDLWLNIEKNVLYEE